MSARIKLLAIIAPALILSACGGSVNRGLESVHQPVVTRADYVFDVATSGYGLAPGEAERLGGWMSSLRLGYGDSVFVDDPTGDPGTRAAVAAEARRYGLFVQDTGPITTGSVIPGTARVVVTRMTASVPGCPNFSNTDQFNFTGKTSANFGCAVNSNLAAMVARPQDLVRGQPGADTVDPATAAKAIDTFRKATPTGASGLQAESTGDN